MAPKRNPVLPAVDVDAVIAAAETEIIRCAVPLPPPEPPRFLEPRELAALDREYDEIFAALCARERVAAFAGSPEDCALVRPAGERVPQYFANISVGYSPFALKVLAVRGMRNLLHDNTGWTAWRELAATTFSSAPSAYAAGTGLSRVLAATGTTVDLDTCVLRAHDPATLRAANAARAAAGLPPFRSAADYASSPAAVAAVVAAAAPILERFVADFALTPAAAEARRVVLPAGGVGAGGVPVATTNAQRGHTAVWVYHNIHAEVWSFHVNAPALDDVRGSLLLAPLHLVKAWRVAKRGGGGGVESFFADCVADACLNQKWRAIEAWLAAAAAADTIAARLDALQASHQAELLPLLSADDTPEADYVAAVWALASAASLRGRPTERLGGGEGEERDVTRDDVADWVRVGWAQTN